MHEAPNFTPQHLAQFAENLIVEESGTACFQKGCRGRHMAGEIRYPLRARKVCGEILGSLAGMVREELHRAAIAQNTGNQPPEVRILALDYSLFMMQPVT